MYSSVLPESDSLTGLVMKGEVALNSKRTASSVSPGSVQATCSDLSSMLMARKFVTGEAEIQPNILEIKRHPQIYD